MKISEVSLFKLPPSCSVTATVNQAGNSVFNSVVSTNDLTSDLTKIFELIYILYIRFKKFKYFISNIIIMFITNIDNYLDKIIDKFYEL